VVGLGGVAWEERLALCVPQLAPGEDGALAVPVFRGQVTLSGPAGTYELAATIERGAAPAGGRLKFRLSERSAALSPSPSVTTWGIDERVRSWLAAAGVSTQPYTGVPAPDDQGSAGERQVILVGKLSAVTTELGHWQELARRVARGSVAVFLAPAALRRGEDPAGGLPLQNKGRAYDFNDWLYHKECVAKAHPIFEGLTAPGIMDWDYYGPVISRTIFDGQDTPSEVMAAAFALGYSIPGGYASGWMLGPYRFGAGQFVFNSFNILENMGAHPAADRLLINLIRYASPLAAAPLAPLPANFAAQLSAIGYV
jgi:hypothetical protein